MQAIQLNCCDAFGAMLWKFTSSYTESFFKAWNIQARMAYGVPRETHTYLVEGVLCECFPSLKAQVLSRYPNFIRSLKNSPSKEIGFLVSLAKSDPSSNTYQNMEYLKVASENESVFEFASWKVLEIFPRRTIPLNDMWRKRILNTLLDIRASQSFGGFNLSYEDLSSMINSLCIS